MGITEILRRIWLFSANKMKSYESFSKQPTQLIVELNPSCIAVHNCQSGICVPPSISNKCSICEIRFCISTVAKLGREQHREEVRIFVRI